MDKVSDNIIKKKKMVLTFEKKIDKVTVASILIEIFKMYIWMKIFEMIKFELKKTFCNWRFIVIG